MAGRESSAVAEKAGSPREERYQQILRAAVEVIAENGFANSRVSEIAARARVADGTIYLYFKSKDQILMAALDEAFRGFLQKARSATEGVADPLEKLGMVIELHLRAMWKNRPLAVVLQTELRQSAKFLEEFSQRQLRSYLQFLKDIIAQGQAAGVFRDDIPANLAVSCLFGALDDVVTAWVLHEKGYDLPEMAGPIRELFLNGVAKRSA